MTTLREAIRQSPLGAAWTRASVDSFGYGTVRGYHDGSVTFVGGGPEVDLPADLAGQVAAKPIWVPCRG